MAIPVQTELELLLNKFNAQLNTAFNAFKGFTTKTEAASNGAARKIDDTWRISMLAVGVYASQAAFKVINAFKNTIGVFAGFEQSLANTFSIVSDGSDKSAADLLILEEAARRVGATTRSTASAAANALYYLASAGFNARESVAALDGVNALAIATNSDLAKSSEFVATTVRQFGLSTSAATDIANTFTAAITSSLATIDKLAKAFEYVGPIAGGLGHTVEETTGALEVLFNQGFSGEKAGRALRRIFVDLADSSSIVNKRLERLGITFDEINPATNSLAEIVQVLDDNYVDASNAAAIFGKISGAQVAALIQSGSAEIERMTEAVTGTSKAFDAMEIQMDTLQGSFDKFKNASEAIKISIGSGLSPVLRALTDVATEMLVNINALPEGLLAVATGLTTTLAAGAALALGIGKMGAAIGLAIPGFNILYGTILAVTGAVVGLALASKKLNEMRMDKLREEYAALVKDLDLTAEETDKFVQSLSRADVTLNRAALNQNNRDLATFRSTLEDIADAYGLTYDQILTVAKGNSEINTMLGDQLDALIAARDIEREAELAVRARGDAQRELGNILAKEAELQRQIDAERKLRAERQAQIEAGLILAFEQGAAKSVLLGDAYNRNTDLARAYQDAIVDLIKLGYGPESDEVKSLIALYEKLQAQYGRVEGSGPPSDLQKRLDIQKGLREELERINQQQLFSNQYGLEYNAIQERSQAVQAAVNKLLQEGFTINGAGMQALLAEFGDLIVTQDASAELAEEYQLKIDEMLKSERELREAERARLLAQAAGNQAAIDAINTYFDLLAFRSAEAEANVQADLLQDYYDKTEALILSETELIEKERDLALARVKGNQAATDAVNRYFDTLLARAKDKELEEGIKEFLDNFIKGLDVATQAFDLLDRAQSEATERFIANEQAKLDATTARIDAQLEAELALIDEAERAALEAAGIVEKTKLQQLEDQLAAAKAAGDAEKVLALTQEIEKTKILEQYEAERTAAIEEAEARKEEARIASERKIANARYKSALMTWRLDLLKATADTAKAVAGAIAASPLTGGLPWSATNAALGAAEIAVITKAKPEAPKFNNGGIVPGSSTKGDLVPAWLNSGELILNQAQQKTVAGQLQDGGRPVQINHSTYLDGRLVAENSAIYYNNGKVRILK